MTSSPDAGASTVRTYGGWRKTRGIGLFGVGPAATVVILACIVGPLVIGALSLTAGAISVVPAAVVAGLTLARYDGLPLSHIVLRRLRWEWAVERGWTSYRATTIDQHPRAWDLPGVLAPTRLLSVPDGRGGEFGLVWNRRTGHLTATLRCAATSTWLVDHQESDGWVANWHSWLASLGYLPMVRSVAVTVETAPEPGTALEDAVLPALDPGAPADVQALMRGLLERSPAASADIDTRVSITFDPSLAVPRLKDLDEAADELSRQLAGLESSLGNCGVTVLGRMTAAQIAGVVRTAFDPIARGEARRPCPDGTDLTWADAGPVATEELWDHYRHDSGVSVTWGWQEAPRQQVTAGVLSRLLSPGRFAKRVTLLYRPLAAGEAARVLEAQVNAASFRDAYRRAQRRDESARDQADRAQAQRAASEEAEGAGVVLMSLYLTATVQDPEQLAGAVAEVEARADQSKIRMRRSYGAQQEAFARLLPAGLS